MPAPTNRMMLAAINTYAALLNQLAYCVGMLSRAWHQEASKEQMPPKMARPITVERSNNQSGMASQSHGL